MSNSEATTPAATDWETRSVSSLTTALVSNTTHKVTPASMADNFVPPDPNEVSVSVVLSANGLVDGGSSLSTAAEAAGPAVGPENRAAFEDHGMLVREAARARRLDDALHYSQERLTTALEEKAAALEKAAAQEEEIAALKAQLKAQDGTSSSSQQDPPDDKKKDDDDDDDDDKQLDSKPSAKPFPKREN